MKRDRVVFVILLLFLFLGGINVLVTIHEVNVGKELERRGFVHVKFRAVDVYVPADSVHLLRDPSAEEVESK